MKFRYKVLMTNIILLSLGIGIVGYLMIKNNYNLALETQISSAVNENNLLQSSIEFRLLDALSDSRSQMAERIHDIGEEVTGSISATQSLLFIAYGDELVYESVGGELSCGNEFIYDLPIGKKQYMITHEGENHFVYVCTSGMVQDKKLNIINKRNINDVYVLMHKQEQHFALLLLLVVGGCSFFMYFVSLLLTRPLETLNRASRQFGEGQYDTRVTIKSKDEVGELADTYNTMAQAVSDHMEELRDMVRRQEQFVADFTHEIKTPMTTIIGYADTLRSKEMERESQVLAASYIFSEGKRLESMSMKLFDFIYTKQHEIEKKPISAEHVMRQVVDSVLPAYESKHIALTLSTEETSTRILGDVGLLKSAFINLLDNARKASKEGSQVLFSGRRQGEGYEISVQDFGVGIAPEHVKRICDEFYMVDKSRARKEGGAGLGLSLAALIFKSHGSELSIESEPGVGTTMRVLLPLYEGELFEADALAEINDLAEEGFDEEE